MPRPTAHLTESEPGLRTYTIYEASNVIGRARCDSSLRNCLLQVPGSTDVLQGGSLAAAIVIAQAQSTLLAYQFRKAHA